MPDTILTIVTCVIISMVCAEASLQISLGNQSARENSNFFDTIIFKHVAKSDVERVFSKLSYRQSHGQQL